MPHLRTRRLAALVLLGSALALVGNTLEPAIYGHKILQLAPLAWRNTALGALTSAGVFVGLLTQPLFGAWSDRTQTRFGPRVPFFVGGALVGCAGLLGIGAAGSFGVLVASVIVLQFGNNAVLATLQALLPDLVPEAQRGRAAGTRTMLEALSAVVGRSAAGFIIGMSPEWGEWAVYAALVLPVVWLAVACAITARAAMAGPRHAPVLAIPLRRPSLRGLAMAYRVDLHAHPAFAWWFLNRFLFWVAFISVGLFVLFYAIAVMGLEQAAAQRFIGQLFIVLGAGVLLMLLPAGWLADRIGRKPLVVAGGLLCGAGLAALIVQRDVLAVSLCGMLIGLGAGLFQSANLALIADLVPRDEAARYLGVANMATAGGSAVARLGGGVLIDWVNAASGSAAQGYVTLYVIAAVLFVLSAIAVLPLRRPGPMGASPASPGQNR